MKNYLIAATAAVILLSACKGKSKEKENQPISALSIIKGQLHHLDTSLYQVTRFETENSITDTTYIKREEIRSYAAPFLSLPDIADKNYDKKYTEDKLIDAQQQTLSITSTAKTGTEDIQKQIIIVNVADPSNGKVQSIYIERSQNAGDSTIEQKLFWEIDKFFSVGSIISKENQPEKTHLTKIAWQ